VRDTPEVIGKYVDSFDPRIVGLTGSPQQIAAAKEYGVYSTLLKAGKDDEEYLVDHSSYIYVMNPQGMFVRAFDPDTPGDRIADTLHELMGKTS
jgi:protein SCO1/2